MEDALNAEVYRVVAYGAHSIAAAVATTTETEPANDDAAGQGAVMAAVVVASDGHEHHPVATEATCDAFAVPAVNGDAAVDVYPVAENVATDDGGHLIRLRHHQLAMTTASSANDDASANAVENSPGAIFDYAAIGCDCFAPDFDCSERRSSHVPVRSPNCFRLRCTSFCSRCVAND